MWQTLVVDPLMKALSFIAGQLSALGVPYPWGFSIIALTVIVKLITLPLTLSQSRSAKRMQELQPQLQALQKKYGSNRERLAQEQMRLYREAGVNPLGGCLPSLVQLPIWIGLYQALLHLAQSGALTGGFLWIPDLSFPNPEVGTNWLWPGAEHWQGWGHLAAYAALPVLTVVTQLITQKMMTPPSTDDAQGAMNSVMMFMPFMFGFFALTFPSGLALYWVTSNLLTMLQQYLVVGKPSAPAGAAAATESRVSPAESDSTETKAIPRDMPRKRTRDARRRRRD